MKTILLSLAFLLITGNMASASNVPESADDVRPILIGSQIPEVVLRAVDGKTFDLAKSVKEKKTVIVFYRGGWCPYCNTHLSELKSVEKELIALGYRILAISADRPEELSKTIDKHHMAYTLLSDSSMDAANAFGIAFRVDDSTMKKYRSFGINLESASGRKHHQLPVPAVFIVGQDGVIRFKYVNPNYKVRLSGRILLEAAKVYSKD